MSVERDTLLIDIEVYWEYFFLGMMRTRDGLRRGIEMSSRSAVTDDDKEQVRKWLVQYQHVGFNSLTFDLPLIWYWILGASNDDLKRAANRIIEGNLRWWEVEDALEIRIPRQIKDNHIDLIEPQPNPFASLKTLNGRLHGKQLQDLPYDPGIWPTPDQMDHLNHYCKINDLDSTHLLWDNLTEAMELRRRVGEQIEQNVMSKSDTQMGLAIIKKRVEAITGTRLQKAKIRPGTTFRYEPPEYISFETPLLADTLERIRQHDFTVKSDGKVDLPKWLEELKIEIGGSTYSMGIGGLHSTESNRAVIADDDYALCDFDVASYYPAIILNTGIFPEATGPAFIEVYRSIRDERIAAKKVKDKVTDKSLKIALNGTFGSLGSPYSFVYSPRLLIAVTLTGQLALLKLIEMTEQRGIAVVSGNTDGIVMRVPRASWAGLDGDRPLPSPVKDVVEEWERLTGFTLEGTEYAGLYNQSVNSYFAIKADGKHKRKGPLGNPWNPDPSDFDPRAQMEKNPQMTICSDAALNLLKHGIPVETTIRQSRDIRQFVTVIKAAGGASWRDEYLGKVIRYYWSVGGDPIYKTKAHATTGNYSKVPKTDGARECMRLPDEFPDDIDYDRYIEEANTILREIGYYDMPNHGTKPVRIFKRNFLAVLHTWMVQP